MKKYYYCGYELKKKTIDMKCSVFIATSLDGFIARPDGSVDWLDTCGKTDLTEAEIASMGDMGFGALMASVDCLIMGRKSMDTIAAMDLQPEQWPYGDTRVIVLSSTVSTPPERLKGKIELFSGTIPELLIQLESEGHRHAYVDGGSTVQSFLNLGEIDEITITKAPIILGEGIPLFRKTERAIRLTEAQSETYANNFIQLKYRVEYAD